MAAKLSCSRFSKIGEAIAWIGEAAGEAAGEAIARIGDTSEQ
jgi:hypothetical protein